MNVICIRVTRDYNLKRFLLTQIFVLLIVSSLITNTRVQNVSGEDLPEYSWPMFGYDSQHQGYTKSPGPETAFLVWKFNASDSVSSPTIAYSRVYFGSNDNYFYCIDAYTGELLWRYETEGQIYESSVIFDQKVYFGSNDGHMYCLHSWTGEFLWKYEIGEYYSHIIIPTIWEGKLYVGKLHKPGVYCIDAYDGVEVWVNEEPQSLEIGLAVSDNRVYVPADNCLYCLDASNGSIIWVTENVFCYSCPTIAEDKVFIGTLYGDMCCYWAENGTEIWAFSTSRLVTSSPAVAYGKVYFGSKDDNVYCLNLTNGESIWRYVTDGAVQSSPAVADGKIYIGSNDHYLYCFDAFSGELLWRYETDYHIAQSPAIANNIVYIGPRRIIYAVGRLDGVPPDDTTYIPGFTFEAVLLGLIIVMYVFHQRNAEKRPFDIF